ncbi:hypothetical protein Dsin_030853 [Dipteronia sinensis]|uniref:Uncharacterized protein n=1 Tax=Dipteronia sinensis TaxID=43782 RepID=A0AAD9ZK59_9ROSI|nr:hypothetical protein Dsin_030853 [Dipteronia sinensis]
MHHNIHNTTKYKTQHKKPFPSHLLSFPKQTKKSCHKNHPFFFESKTMSIEFNSMFKLSLIGNSSVGKSCPLLQFVTGDAMPEIRRSLSRREEKANEDVSILKQKEKFLKRWKRRSIYSAQS